ncbi:MAG: hypothetical protein R3311_21840, partial [Oceanisphaera sp.]|nr:hypothetical protein [Oceanisphaera sp.]
GGRETVLHAIHMGDMLVEVEPPPMSEPEYIPEPVSGPVPESGPEQASQMQENETANENAVTEPQPESVMTELAEAETAAAMAPVIPVTEIYFRLLP